MREYSFLSLGPSGFHRIAYSEWGDFRNRRIVVCGHGLTRNRHDFDFLAATLTTANSAENKMITAFLSMKGSWRFVVR